MKNPLDTSSPFPQAYTKTDIIVGGTSLSNNWTPGGTSGSCSFSLFCANPHGCSPDTSTIFEIQANCCKLVPTK